MTWVSRLFLTGFASTALFGPLVGRLCDSYGRKAGTLVFSLLYSLGAYSTKSPLLGVLLMGRVLGGIGTSLLFSAPEAWLVGEAGREGVESSLGDTFGLVSASVTSCHCFSSLMPYDVHLMIKGLRWRLYCRYSRWSNGRFCRLSEGS